MATQCVVFYSWESDHKDCKSFIENTIDKIALKLKGTTTVAIDRDTIGIPGAPDIGDSIFEKIDRCDLFIADVTIINEKFKTGRKTPNPNVLIELGYAIKAVGWDRIIILSCSDYGAIDELPFDINHRRIGQFSLGHGKETNEEKDKVRKEERSRIISGICETIDILKKKKMLYGGNRNTAPKLEINSVGCGGGMSGIVFRLKNVSSKIISDLENQDLFLEFADGSVKTDLQRANKNVKIRLKSLSPGQETDVLWENRMFGETVGPALKTPFENFIIHWRFKCEDENNNQFYYEVAQKISSSKALDELNNMKCTYIG